MAKARFVRHPNFPVGELQITAGGMLWKLEVREWAFAEVNLADVDAGLTPTSNNPTIVTDHYLEKPDKIRGTLSGRDMTVRFYAHERGFSMLYLFDKEPFTPVSDHLQVEVLQRRAPGSGCNAYKPLGGNLRHQRPGCQGLHDGHDADV